MSEKERLAKLEEYMNKAFEKINMLEKRLDATRDQLLKMQAEADGAKPLDLRDSKFNPLNTLNVPPDVEHFKEKDRSVRSIPGLMQWIGGAPTISDLTRSKWHNQPNTGKSGQKKFEHPRRGVPSC